jgi:hypothetical protein
MLSALIGLIGLMFAARALPQFAAKAIGCPDKGVVVKGAGMIGVVQDTYMAYMLATAGGLIYTHVVELLWQQQVIIQVFFF